MLLAVIHAQFEVAHPFVDGNGRIGCATIAFILNEMGILLRPTFHMSACLEVRREEYCKLLWDLNGPETWNGWISFFLDAITVQAREYTEKVLGIVSLSERLKARVLDLIRPQYAVLMLDHLLRQLILTPNSLVEEDMPTKPTVMSLLATMKRSRHSKDSSRVERSQTANPGPGGGSQAM